MKWEYKHQLTLTQKAGWMVKEVKISKRRRGKRAGRVLRKDEPPGGRWHRN